MCKLLLLNNHPAKFIECKRKCNACTSAEYTKAALLLWFLTLSVSIIGLMALS
jgi:hypothetical protein